MTSAAPMLSVVTVCFNAAATISDTMRSVGAQDCASFEHLVIDGGSKDVTCAIVEALRTERTIILSEPDRGLYDAMNKGLARAKGEFVCFLNADDLYASPQVLSRICERLRQSGGDVIYGDIEFVDPEDVNRVTRRWVSGRFSSRAVQLGWHPPHPAFVARTALLRALGGFKLDLPIAADYELMLKVLLQSNPRIEYEPQQLVRMREGGSSTRGLMSYVHGNLQSYRAMRRSGLKFPLLAVSMKPLRKLHQFLPRLSGGASLLGPHGGR